RHHVEGGPLAHQGEDEGGARVARGRDERPHLLPSPVLRVRRRHLFGRAPAGAGRARRPAAVAHAGRRAEDVLLAGDPQGFLRGEEVPAGGGREGEVAQGGRHHGGRRRGGH